jgi:hypothetical protein
MTLAHIDVYQKEFTGYPEKINWDQKPLRIGVSMGRVGSDSGRITIFYLSDPIKFGSKIFDPYLTGHGLTRTDPYKIIN